MPAFGQRKIKLGGTPAPEPAVQEFRPHEGAQTAFLANPADICIGGGSAGGGKTYALLAEPMRHLHVSGFNAVIFRRTSPQLRAAGGPWAESFNFYPSLNGRPAAYRWVFQTSRRTAEVQFSHLQHEKDRLSWKGAQIALILFDQLEDFTESQFWYLLSRNRSACGVRPYIRATCNPVPADDPIGGWLRKLLDWWIDPETGYAIPERAGRIRWFTRVSEQLHWGDSPEEVLAKFAHFPADKLARLKIKSLSFVPMGLDDNPTLRQADPDYEATLEALPYVDRMRLRYGNWNVRDVGKGHFDRTWFKILPAKPTDGAIRWLRFWDCAGTADGGDATAGALVGISADQPPHQKIYIADIKAGHWSTGKVDEMIWQTARMDGMRVSVREEQEPGSSGKAVVVGRANRLMGWDYAGITSSVSKLTRWKPLIAQAQNGHVYLVQGEWNEPFLKQAETADGTDRMHDDQVDAVAGAFLRLAAGEGMTGLGGVVRLSGF